MRPLLIYRQRLRRIGPPRVPWHIDCGCGARIDCYSFEHALWKIQHHRYDHPRSA